MQHDSVIWKIISPGSGGFCSFRRQMPNCPTKFCKNSYNVLGICHPLACPLANSRYATIREHKGNCYLLIKTIERAHSPAKHWEKIKLSKDYMTALKQIDEYLQWWPKWSIHKCKLRLTKMHQYLIRARKLALTVQPKLLRIWKPYERQQQKRERKAEIAAKITNVIKSELLERLHEGVYEGIYNFPLKQYNEILDETGKQEELESDSDSDLETKIRNKLKNKKKPLKNKKKQSQTKTKDEYEDDEEDEKDRKQQRQRAPQQKPKKDQKKGDYFVGNYEDSDIEYVESDLEGDDIEDFRNEYENEKEIEYEYEMENGFSQQPNNINDMSNITGQSIRSLKTNNNNSNDNSNSNNNNNNKKGSGNGDNASVLGKRGYNKNDTKIGNDSRKNGLPPKKRRKKIKPTYD